MNALKLLALGVVLSAAVGCGRQQQEQQQPELTVAGSTSVHPFIEMVAEKYMEENPGRRVSVQAGGSTAGVQAVREGAAQIGMVSRELQESEKDLTPIEIARDGIAIIVHATNPVAELTKEQVSGIFTGTIKDWSEVGGPAGPIRAVTREQGSGTRGAFQELVMHDAGIAAAAMVQQSNGSIREVVSNDPGSIGYISLGMVNDRVKALSIDGVKASAEDVRNGSYKLSRPFLFVIKGQPDEMQKAFIDYVLSAPSQALLEEEGLVAVK